MRKSISISNILVVVIVAMSLIGCITTRTLPDGTIVKQELDKDLIGKVINEYGPQALPMIEAYTQAYLAYKQAQEANALASKQQALLNKLEVAKKVLEAAKEVKGK